MDQEISDKELVQMALNADTEALNTLIRRYQDVAYAAAYSVVRNFHDARDIAQEAWIKAYRRLNTFDPDRQFGAWLYRISQRCAIQWVYSHRNVPLQGLSTAADVPASGSLPDEVQERRELLEIVHRALSALSKTNRETTVLYYINGYSQRDVSEILGVPLGTVKRRLHDSRKLLQKKLMEALEQTFGEKRLPDEFTQEASTQMIDWYVKPSYTAELANFLWSIGEGRYCSKAYAEEKAIWRKRLGDAVASRIDRFADFSKTAMSQSALGTIFHFSDAASLDEVSAELDNLEEIKSRVLRVESKDPGWIDSIFMHLEESRTLFREILDALRSVDYDRYWHEEILPVVSQRCEELHRELSDYSVKEILTEVNSLLGPEYNISYSPKPIYLTYFGYALGYRLPDDNSVYSFKADRAIEVTRAVEIFIHELLYSYNPSQPVLEHLKRLSESQFYARNLEMYQYYWGGGYYHDFVVAAAEYVSVKLGVVSDEKAFHYLYTNEGGTSVLGVIIYNNMRVEKLEEKTYDEFLLSLFDEGVIQVATLESEYYRILEQRVGGEEAEKRRKYYQEAYAKYEATKDG